MCIVGVHVCKGSEITVGPVYDEVSVSCTGLWNLFDNGANKMKPFR